jgi:hypothetical protein
MMHASSDLFLGVLPDWVGQFLSVLGAPAILLAIVVFILGRKQANRKLDVDEGTLKRSEFDSFTEAQNTALADARSQASNAQNTANSANDRLDVMDDMYDQMRDSINWLRTFVKKLLSQPTAYKMTPEESRQFDMTKPPIRPPRTRAAAK